jgi:2-polyprenyl-6-methoxyphenol hydroxylase-like FAD-dependent oxidoreductase
MGVLLNEADKAGIQIQYGKALKSITESSGQVNVLFADGTTDSADFLLGCDGIHSAVRRLHVDPDIVPEYSGICNMFSLIPSQGLPSYSALDLEAINATVTANGLVAVTPSTSNGDTLYWFFSREVPLPASGNTQDGWEEHGKNEVNGLKSTVLALLGSARGDWGDLMRAVIESTSVVKFYPVFRMPQGGKWSKGRCLLLGDSAHAMQPHASQGVSMALEDVFLLSNILQSGHSIQDGIRVYEEKRRVRVEEMQNLAERNGTLRKKVDPLRLWVNELGMSALLFVYKVCSLDKLGLGQTPLVYDVEEEDVTKPTS